CHLPAFPKQLLPHLLRPVHLPVLVPDPADLHFQRPVPPPAVRTGIRIGLAGRMAVVGRRSDLQHPADRLDSVGVAVFGDEPGHGLKRRSSSAWAKYADALRRISLACRSSRTSRSSAFIRARSSVVSPGRSPWSRSARRTHRRNVSAVQPIFPAIDAIAAHCEPCSSWCSSTIRTARSRTSGEYFTGLLMTP